MIYPIYIYGSPVLRKENEEIDKNYPELKQLIEDMYETMNEASGVGLAAPQIGKSIQLAVIDTSPVADENPEMVPFKSAVINPEIYEYGDEEVLMNEGCLSVPGINEDVYRPDQIRIRYLDENFVEHDEQYEGYTARVLQHELDHLEAAMFVDHLSAIRKTLLKSKLTAMSKGKYSAEYKTRQGR